VLELVVDNLPIPAIDIASFNPEVVQAIFIAGFVFISAVLVGFSRHYFVSSSLKGVWAGFVMGIIAVVGLGGFILYGSRSLLSGEKAEILPENVRNVLTSNKESLNSVLGVEAERKRPTAQSVVSDYNALTPLDVELAKSSICKISQEEEE